MEVVKVVVRWVAESGVLALGWVGMFVMWRQMVKEKMEMEEKYERLMREVLEVMQENAKVLGGLATRIEVWGGR